MSDVTSKVKGAVDKAASAARDLAQDATNMSDKSMENTRQDEDDSCKVTPEAMLTYKQYGEGNDEQYDKQYDEKYNQRKEQYAPVSELDMSPVSQESQKLTGSMEREAMFSSAKGQMQDSDVHEDMSKSNTSPSQCMPESGNTAKQS